MKPRPPRFWGGHHTARTLALQVLLDCRRQDAFVQEVLDRQLGLTPLTGPDRRLTTQLVYGVLRRRGTLQALLRPLVTRSPHHVEPWLWDVLALGACQLALLTQVPVHAALHETVELAALYGRPGAKGFLNGVLRTLASLITDEYTEISGADALPLAEGRYRRLARPVLPDPAAHPLEYLSDGFSLPPWLAQRWLTRWGEKECHRLGFWFASPAHVTLRCNPLRIERAALMEALVGSGVTVEPAENPQGMRMLDAAAIRELPGYAEGWFSVQDESAMRVAPSLAPIPGMTLLDLCAAPGGKTTHLAELMRNQGRIIACDVDDRRLQTVSTLAARLGLTIIEIHRLQSSRGDDAPAETVDGVLVDAPCSNTGVLGRRPEARWRLRPADLTHLVALQGRLLRTAAQRVKRGGVLVYSTCSIEPEENQGIVRQFLAEFADFRLEKEEEAVPGQPADGGFWAKLRREGPSF